MIGLCRVGLVLLVLFCPSGASAHTRSQSFSTWTVAGNAIEGVYQVDAYRVTQLSETPQDLAALLSDHLAKTITVTQNDIRQIQLAKGALYAGARLLMDHMGIDAVERVTLAGAFGSNIDTKYAMILGMIPDCDLAKVTSAGNAAGTGARIALLNVAARRELEKVVRDIEKIETAVEPKFQEHFVGAMAIPHKTAPYPHLAKAVALPAPKVIQPSDEDGGRRRRRRG